MASQQLLEAQGAEDLLPQHDFPAALRLCGKLAVLDLLLCKLHARGHKVLSVCSELRISGVTGMQTHQNILTAAQ